MNKFFITTLGCKVNQCESELIAKSLTEAGWRHAGKDEKADVCIINTCTVTQKASMQSRQAIRKAIRANPGACVVVTGCYAQTEPDEIRKIKGADYVIGHADKHKIPEIIGNWKLETGNRKPETGDWKPETGNWKPDSQFRTRSFLKIQDGCNAFCTYCIVPYARGRSRSMPVENVLDNIRQLKQTGFREVVLSGIHIGTYGLDLSPEANLTGLLHRINDSNLIERVRMSSIEPHELTCDIIKLVAASDIFCKHFHIPLQSGDDHILKKMHRPYSNSFFRDLVLKIKKIIPDAGIGVDILVGFPGETETAFENTYKTVEELPVTYLHVFPFSSREGTPAHNYPDKVPQNIIKIRSQRIRELGNNKKNEFYKGHIGKTVEVLIESTRDRATGLLKGVTSNYIPVLLSGEDDLKNSLVRVRVDNVDDNNTVSAQEKR